jgi:SMODS-associating 2TM, beta-strand rich effector domain
MINALPAATVVRAVTTFIVIICALLIFGPRSDEASQLVKGMGIVVGLVNAVVLLLTWGPAFRLLHRCTFAQLWWFPLLDGRWKAQAWSNWPIIEATMEAATGSASPFNPLVDTPTGDRAPIEMDVEVKSTLLGIDMAMAVPGKRRGSHSIFVRPQWCRPGLPTIYYVYRQEDHEPVALSDAQAHLGAGILQYYPEAGELRGTYWTERQHTRGLNTAGTIVLIRNL